MGIDPVSCGQCVYTYTCVEGGQGKTLLNEIPWECSIYVANQYVMVKYRNVFYFIQGH